MGERDSERMSNRVTMYLTPMLEACLDCITSVKLVCVCVCATKSLWGPRGGRGQQFTTGQFAAVTDLSSRAVHSSDSDPKFATGTRKSRN